MKHVLFKHLMLHFDSCSRLFTVKLFLNSTTRRINTSATICCAYVVSDDRQAVKTWVLTSVAS